MKSSFRPVITLVAAVALSSAANALSITPSSGTLNTTRWEGNDTSQAVIDTVIAPMLGTATLQYKNDVPGSESGPLTASYNTTFLNTPPDPSGATIVYVSGPMVSPTAFLLVKDGNQTPAWYLYNLTALGWNGSAQLDLSNFWPNQGAISHVSLYGGGSVPDGGATVALLGLGLLGLAMLRHRFHLA